MAPTLGYWSIRGLAHSLRMILRYNEDEFEDKQYTCGGPPDFCRDEWDSVKFTLGLPLPNLPYYVDGNTKLTQSQAILYYFARKFDLGGKTEEEKIRCDMYLAKRMDFLTPFGMLCYVSADFEADKKNYIAQMPVQFGEIESFLGSNKWIAGESLTVADFCLWDMLDGQRIFLTTCLDAFPKLKAFMARFEALPKIKCQLESPDYMRWPLQNRVAKWGGDLVEPKH